MTASIALIYKQYGTFRDEFVEKCGAAHPDIQGSEGDVHASWR
jgi:hypothetical protein